MTLVEVSGQYLTTKGLPATGYVRFTAKLISPGSAKLPFDQDIAVLDSTGSFRIKLPAVDEIQGVVWTYEIEEHVQGVPRAYDVDFHAASASAGVDLPDSAPGAGIGTVTSVDGKDGDVVLSGDYQPLDSELTILAGLTSTVTGQALLQAATAAAGRSTLGLGSASTFASGAFEVAGAAAAVQAASQPVDSDLTAIAALSTTSFGRSVLTLANGAAGLTLFGAQAAGSYQPLDSDLTAIAALSTTSYGQNLLTLANLAALYTTLGVDTDGTLAANSDVKLPSQKAVKTYADQLIASADAMVFKGVTDCAANPNYPAANRGDTYRVSVAGKIGGASGVVVEVGDLFLCLTDGTSAGNQATVGANWSVAQTNIDGAVVGPASSTDARVATFSGTSGKIIQDGGVLLAALALLASPTFTGVPAAPTASPGTNTTQLATTAYADAIAALKANLASPTFTGTPLSTTAAVDTNTTQIATTAYVIAQAYAKLVSPTFTGTPLSTTAAVDTNTTQIATTAYVIGQAYAKLASPTFTGNPLAPTPAADDNDTSIATTAYVQTELTAYASDTVTFTNKRRTERVTTIVSSATPTINTDTCDAVTITALAAAITSFTTNLSGTPTNFQKLLMRIKDDGTARALTFGTSFEAKGVALPTTTVISKVLTLGFLYDTVSAKWGLVASAQEA